MKASLLVPFFNLVVLFCFVLFTILGTILKFPGAYLFAQCLFPPVVFVLFCLVFPLFILVFVVVVVASLLLLFLNFSR